jgi:hypothetical protein
MNTSKNAGPDKKKSHESLIRVPGYTVAGLFELEFLHPRT